MNRLYRGSFIQLLCNDRLFQAILCCKFFKFRKRIHNCLIGYTICKSHITGACEGASRYHKDVIFLTGFTEGFFVFNRRFYKEIEGTLWFDALKSAVFQAIIKCLPIFIISCKISLGVYTFLQLPSGSGTVHLHSQVYGLQWLLQRSALRFRLPHQDHQISDTFTRKGKRFAVGIAHNSIVIIFRQVWDLHAIISQLTVWLIGDQVDHGSELFLFCFQDCGKFLDRFF